MRTKILTYVLDLLLRNLDAQVVKELVDDFLDKIEDSAAGNDPVLAGIAFARQVLSIPDDIGGDED